MTLRHLVVVAFAFIGGCTTAHSLDGEPAIARQHILGRKYILNADAAFPRARIHFIFTFEGSFPKYGQISLAKGTIVHVKHVEDIHTENIETGEEVYQVQAIVQTGPEQGSRISIGNVSPFSASHETEFEAEDWAAELAKSSALALSPLPAKSPGWLDVGVLPPQVKPVSAEVLRRALHDPDWAIRYYALMELGERDHVDPETIAACVAALQDEVSEVRKAALDDLMHSHSDSREVLDALAKRFSDPNVSESDVAQITDAFVTAGPAGMKTVGKFLDSNNPIIFNRAVGALAKFGPAAREYIPRLVEALHQEPSWETATQPVNETFLGELRPFSNGSVDPILDAITAIDGDAAKKIMRTTTQSD